MMTEYSIKQTTGAPNLVFEGELLAKVSSQRRNSLRWTELEVYETRGGSFVYVQIGATTVESERRFSEAKIVATKGELIAAIGMSRLAVKLLSKLGIDEVRID